MVITDRYCKVCEYLVCSEEEYEKASKEEKQAFRVKWNHHLNSKGHENSVLRSEKRKTRILNIEGKEKVLKDMTQKFCIMLNKEFPYLLPDGKKILDIHFEYYDEKLSKYTDDIFREHGFLPTK